MLETAALTAIVLALLGLVLGAVSERRDEAARAVRPGSPGRGAAQPPSPARLRASLAGLAGAVGGVATGLLLSLLVVRFVELTANATAPEPPLQLAPDWPLIALAALAVALAAIACVAAATWHAFRGRVPARYGETA